MQKIKVSELKEHPQNAYYFDNMSGDKWSEFLKSVETSGIIEPIICNQDKVIISGHQRYRACKELDINEVLCDIRIYDDKQQELKDLIETNIRQRGDISSSSLKMGRIIKALEEYYGIKKGKIGKEDNPPLKTQEQLANELGMSQKYLQSLKKLTDLIPEFQELLEGGKITSTMASKILCKLPIKEQKEVLEDLGVEGLSDKTQAQLKDYVDKLHRQEEKNQELRQALDREKNKPKEKEIIKIDNTDYTLVNKLKEEKRNLELKVIQLQDKVSKSNITYTQSPEILQELDELKNQIKQKNKEIEEKNQLENELNEKKMLLSRYTSEDTNLDLVSTTSENRKKMMDFVQDMAKYNYIAETFNDIPDASRKEWVRAVYSIYKWSKGILDVVKHDDVTGVDSNIIDADFQIN